MGVLGNQHSSIRIIPNSGTLETHLQAIRDVNFEANCHMVYTSLSVSDRLFKTLSHSKSLYVYIYVLCVHVHMCDCVCEYNKSNIYKIKFRTNTHLFKIEKFM